MEEWPSLAYGAGPENRRAKVPWVQILPLPHKDLKMIVYNNIENEEWDITDEHLFLGDCLGVALLPRGENDNHITINILIEDDGGWFIGGSVDCSSVWIDDLIDQLNKANEWMNKNALPDVYPNGVCGYKFK